MKHNKVHQCKVCLKCFGSPSDLVDHIRIHTGEKPFVCRICDKRFAHITCLKSHQATHSDEKMFKCKLCPGGKNFRTKQGLSVHMKRHRCAHVSALWQEVSYFFSFESLCEIFRLTSFCLCGRKFYTTVKFKIHE